MLFEAGGEGGELIQNYSDNRLQLQHRVITGQNKQIREVFVRVIRLW